MKISTIHRKSAGGSFFRVVVWVIEKIVIAAIFNQGIKVAFFTISENITFVFSNCNFASMNTRRILPVIAFALLLPLMVRSAGVPLSLARQVALNFCIRNGKPAGLVPSCDITPAGFGGQVSEQQKFRLYYHFQLAGDQGFIVVAADDRIPPVLGYSFEKQAPGAPVPLALTGFLQEMEQEILMVMAGPDRQAAQVRKQWEDLLYSPPIPLKSGQDISPLITTRWDQGCFYNAFCPSDVTASGTCLHALAGSGAVAMAQIMKYYKYPAHGTGEHGYVHPQYGIQYANFSASNYNYSAMPDSVVSTSDNVATLIYQCGIAQNMNFGVTVSGSDSTLIDSAFIKYFGYPVNAAWQWKATFTSTEWLAMLKQEIDASHPLVYHGGNGGSQGSYFICDGYQGADFFHFNWGQGGAFNGYFYLNSLTPGSNNFNSSQGAIFNLSPTIPVPDSYVMDFESVADFSLTFNDWTVKDADLHDTYGITNYTFPHQTQPMAFLAFNPAKVTPSMASDQAMQPHGGARFGACFNSNPPSNDDWFISPQIQLGANGNFSFWIKSYNNLYGLDNYTVAVSATDNNPASFTVISGPQPLQTTLTWTKKTFYLSGYNNQKVYVAIHCVSNDHFLMMIDDLEVKTHGSSSLTADFSSDKTSLMAGDSVNFSDQSAGAPSSWTWTFTGGTPSTSNLQNPSGIRYNAPGNYQVKLKVSNGTTSDSITRTSYVSVTAYPSSMSLDFESVADFSLQFNPWTDNDIGGGNTYGIQSVTFPNAYYPMAYICFNPAQTIPPLVNMVPHSGQKLGCCFSSTPPRNPNNKWLISPRLSLGLSPKIEFWVKSYNPQFGYEAYNVAVSTTGLAPADFIAVNTTPESSPGDWTLKSYDLSAYTGQNVYIGIQCVTNDGFIFMLDDISITSSLGVDDLPALSRLVAYPNPASDHLTLKYGSPIRSSLEITMINSLGEPVRSWTEKVADGTVTLDTHDILRGIYFLQVTDGTTRVNRKISIIN